MSEKATLPKLPFGYKDLEPVISGEIMELHHSKHHAAYVTNYNVALEKLQEATAKSGIFYFSYFLVHFGNAVVFKPSTIFYVHFMITSE